MTTDALRDAIQAQVRASTGIPTAVVTEYAVVAAHVDLATADRAVGYTTCTDGAPHALLGLVDIATDTIASEID